MIFDRGSLFNYLLIVVEMILVENNLHSFHGNSSTIADNS